MRITGGKRAVASAALVAATAPGLAFAEDTFRAEAGASYSRTKGDDFRRTSAGADGTYYFDNLPSRPKDTPYDQVQFVEHVGSVTAFSDWTSSDRDNVERVSNGYDYGATLQLARPDTFLRIGAAAAVFNGGTTRSGGVEIENEAKVYQLSLGGYLARATSIDLNWATSKTTTSSTLGLPDIKLDTIGVTGQHLARLPGGSHVAMTATAMQFTLRSEGTPTEKNNDFLLQAIYYPTQVLGIKLGVRIDRGDEDSLEGETYIAGLKTYVTPAISLSVDYQKFNAKAAGFDFDTVMLRAAMRF
jgi:hypothetical protein